MDLDQHLLLSYGDGDDDNDEVLDDDDDNDHGGGDAVYGHILHNQSQMDLP